MTEKCHQRATPSEKLPHTAEFLERNHGIVILLVVVHDDLLVVAFTNDQTSVTPTEVIHAPEGIDGEEETVHRVSGSRAKLDERFSEGVKMNVRNDIDNHPADKHELSLEDEDDGLKQKALALFRERMRVEPNT